MTGFDSVDTTSVLRSREALLDAGVALARTISIEHVYREVAQQVRRALQGDALALALADDDPSALHLAHQAGYSEDAASLERRLTPAWRDALATGRVILNRSAAGLELTAPMTTGEAAVGVMTLLTDDLPSPQRLEECGRDLVTVAALTAGAIERARLVRRLEHRRRLEATVEVSAGVAHELRNPLFGISSAAQLLRFRAREDPVVEKNVGRILREVERLNRMVNALLEYGRPNPVRLSPGDPDQVWDDVLESNRGLLESRSLVLTRTRPNAPARCELDAEQLTQLFVNVLVNAVDAAPEASDLTLTSTVLPSGAWRCRLTNGGPALTPETLSRVFEIFFSTKPAGTGIGLALCQRIAEEHHGTISIESAPESGTTLTVQLPPAA